MHRKPLTVSVDFVEASLVGHRLEVATLAYELCLEVYAHRLHTVEEFLEAFKVKMESREEHELVGHDIRYSIDFKFIVTVYLKNPWIESGKSDVSVHSDWLEISSGKTRVVGKDLGIASWRDHFRKRINIAVLERLTRDAAGHTYKWGKEPTRLDQLLASLYGR